MEGVKEGREGEKEERQREWRWEKKEKWKKERLAGTEIICLSVLKMQRTVSKT